MKTLLFVFLLVFSGCSNVFQNIYSYDWVYYNPTYQIAHQVNINNLEKYDKTINNDMFFYHNNFSYTARIKRFHRPLYRWSYFDTWHTNMFWYTRNPFHFGIPIRYSFDVMFFRTNSILWDPFNPFLNMYWSNMILWNRMYCKSLHFLMTNRHI